jgi:hypothetical protein
LRRRSFAFLLDTSLPEFLRHALHLFRPAVKLSWSGLRERQLPDAVLLAGDKCLQRIERRIEIDGSRT